MRGDSAQVRYAFTLCWLAGVVLVSAVAVVAFILVRRKRAAEAEEQRKKQYEAEAKRYAASGLPHWGWSA